MLGFYDYTVWLTYLSLLSAGTGIIVSLNGMGHPYIGVFFLMFCGFCDAFDGRVARSKKNRTEMEKQYGIQIDSLADLVAFGALPVCIGNAMVRSSSKYGDKLELRGIKVTDYRIAILLIAILLFYLLAALIRLAYFNVTEEERSKVEGGARKYYEGLPVTSASLIFPTVMLIQFISPIDVTPLYFVTLLLTGIAFISKFKLAKPGLRGIMIMIGIGLLEGICLLVTLKLHLHF